MMKPEDPTHTFPSWLDQYMKKKPGGADVPARPVVLLAVLERLRTTPSLNADDHLTPNRQQLVDHNNFVKLGLERFNLANPLAASGRRASNVAAWIGPLFDWLRNAGFEGLRAAERESFLDSLASVAALRTQEINEAEPLIARFNKGTAKAIVADVLDQAQMKNRAKDVAEYLIGAKLQMLFGESVIPVKNVNTPSDYGDFQIGRAAIEVTVNPADQRHIEEITRILRDTTLRIWLIVRLRDREKWQVAVDATFDSIENERIVVTDVETFLCQNVSERGSFEPTGEHETLTAIISIYNERWLPTAGGGGLRIISGDPQAEHG
ncbi:MAG: DUF4928 family protein [Planctomycetes bacterium]|nr:DUF4928 family protein [Planctomycetota bacterium]